MDFEDLLFEKDGDVAIITLNRPDRMNAMSAAMTQGMLDLVREMGKDPDVKVIVLTGAGRGFCVGADVSKLSKITGADGKEPEPRPVTLPHSWESAQLVFAQCDKPIIGATFKKLSKLLNPIFAGSFSICYIYSIRPPEISY